MKNYYATLGVSISATALEIKRAYRALAVKYHPDKNPDPKVVVLFKEINEAYDVLSDPQKKMFYDLRRENPLSDIIVEEPEPPRPRHRDPRYRGTGRTVRNEKSAGNRLHDLKAKYIRYMGWLCWLGVAVPALLFIDYYLPRQTKRELIVDGYMMGRPRNDRAHSFKYLVFTTESGKEIKLKNLDEIFLEVGETIEYTQTPIYSTLMTISDQNTTLEMGYIYEAIAFVPALLLAIAIMGIYIRQDIEFYFSACVASGVLLLVSLYLILSL